ncbi:uncharacterized protein RB166_001665 [Leptodactylus fuscus]|uniref:uncharacterized protein LOC142183602 n=1 Tax=Leptodactylus fuscus TaxID=238119 RepID=UPI003F4E7B6C
MESNPKRAKSDITYIRVCDSFGHTAEQLIYPIVKAEESVRVMFELQKESLMNLLGKAGVALCSPTKNNFLDGNIFIECEPFSKWNNETLRRFRDDVKKELRNFNIQNVLIDHIMDQSTLSQPIISEFNAIIHKLESKYQYHIRKYHQTTRQDTVPTDLQIIGTLLKELRQSRVSVAVLSHNAIGKSFLLNLLLLLTSESYQPSKKIKLPKDIAGKPTVEIVKEEHFEDLPEAIKDFLEDVTDDQQDFKNILEPICHELNFSTEMDQKNDKKSYRELSRFFTDHSRVSIQPYLLPEKDDTEDYHCTTSCVIHLRHGVSFQAKVEHFSEEELQNQLFELVFLGKEASKDKGKTHRKSLKKRFAVLTKNKLQKQKLHEMLEVITSPKDIILCDEVKKISGKTELYIGNGVNLTNDRLALQALLKEYTLLEGKDEDSVMRLKVAALKRIVVYVPSNLLYGGKEILEMPGTNESDPLAMNFIQNELDTADAVMVLSEYAFKIACKEVKDVLRDSCFIKKWIKNPQEYKLMLVSFPEKNQPYQFGKNDINKLKKITEGEKKQRTGDFQELERQLSLVLSEEMKENIFSTTVLPVLHCSIHAMEGDPNDIIKENRGFLEHTGIYALFRELDQLTLKRKSVIIEEIKNKLAEYENRKMDEASETQIDESQMDEEIQDKRHIGSASKGINFKNESEFLKKNEDIFKELKNQQESLIEKTLNEQLKNTMEKAAKSAKTNLADIRSTVTEKRFFNPQYSGRHSDFKINLYNRLFGHLDEEISAILHDLIEHLRSCMDKYKQNAITLFTEELKGNNKLKTATVGNSLQSALSWYMGRTRSSLNEDSLLKAFKDLLTESMKENILQPAYTKTTENTKPTKEEVAAQIEQVLLDVQSSFKKHIFSLYNDKWPANLTRFMVRSCLPLTSISNPGCTYCGDLKCKSCLYIVSSNTFTSRAKKVYRLKEDFCCKTKNVIYLITCKRCSLQYVGQTKNPVHRRFAAHLSTISRKMDVSLSKHFNLPQHSLQDISLMVIEKVENHGDLLKREEYWIKELKTLEPNGMNAII